MITHKYNIVNNLVGWAIFVVALLTYWLTLEPTASYWDCGEFIIQADKLEIGHPPGNPIFMLTARFFANFAADAQHISVMVNAMSGLLSALTILLLFWSITHLCRRLIVRDNDTSELSPSKYLVIMGAGVVGALAYCWSDTFWFSAVEGEVYAFSSFCTALVFWLILKWEDHADQPRSDRYLILIAYIIGVSIAVHLLNLLCIPAIVLVFVFRKWKNVNLKGAFAALLISFLIIALVLFGLVPGFIKMAQQFELLFVNGFGMPFNSGALAYVIVTLALFIWALYELRVQRNTQLVRISFLLAVTVSGMLFMGSGWWFGFILTALLIAYLWIPKLGKLPVRVLSLIMWSIAVIFVGYSSYALILIRSSADTPMNQNSPDNVFDLAVYLNREQYGENPLIYGETLNSGVQRKVVGSQEVEVTKREDGTPVTMTEYQFAQVVKKGKPMYVKGVRGAVPKSESNFLSPSDITANTSLSKRDGDYYVKKDYKSDYKMNPELNMLFPRIYSRMHKSYYPTWVRLDTTSGNLKEIYAIDERTGEKVPEPDYSGQPILNPITGKVSYPGKMGYRPTYGQNLEYFLNYQLNHMYWRYFMWNFAGRQNDVLNQNGELDAGNWITGISAFDNARLGDQSLLPDDLGKDNKGHNVYFMLPLILGLIGLLWQAFAGRRGIEQFWVVFFLFFMTGIAIVLYLNQPPMQPRERDYAFAGSFYAFAIWIGLGVAGLWQMLKVLLKKKDDRKGKEVTADNTKKSADEEELQKESLVNPGTGKNVLYAAIAAVVIGLVIPIQMVSQTWDDHDRSGRYAARDYAINYLESLEPNAIVFCNGDNDTFPLWYAQEVEGVRPDVKIVNLSYLASDWYVNQMRKKSYTADPVHFTATPADVAYGNLDVTIPGRDRAPADLLESLKLLYREGGRDTLYNYPSLKTSVVTIPVDKKAVVARGLVAAKDSNRIVDEIVIDLAQSPAVQGKGYISLGELMMLDIIATNAAEGWPRPIYWCSTVGDEYHLGLTDYLMSTGMTQQLMPTIQQGVPSRTDRAYDVITKKYRWGGADTKGKAPYFDETARRMLYSVRSSMLDLASALVDEGINLKDAGNGKEAAVKFNQALKVVDMLSDKLSENTVRYNMAVAMTLPEIYGTIARETGNEKAKEKAMSILKEQMEHHAQYLRYNTAMNMSFVSPSMTIDSKYAPYQYYRMVELYENYGGDMKWVEQLLGRYGMKIDDVKRFYEQAYGYGGSPETSDMASYIAELSEVAAAVALMQTMNAEEYAKQTNDNKMLDSIFYGAVEQYVAYGIPRDLIDADPNVKKVDMNRSKRLHDEYQRNNPD